MTSSILNTLIGSQENGEPSDLLAYAMQSGTELPVFASEEITGSINASIAILDKMVDTPVNSVAMKIKALALIFFAIFSAISGAIAYPISSFFSVPILSFLLEKIGERVQFREDQELLVPHKDKLGSSLVQLQEELSTTQERAKEWMRQMQQQQSIFQEEQKREWNMSMHLTTLEGEVARLRQKNEESQKRAASLERELAEEKSKEQALKEKHEELANTAIHTTKEMVDLVMKGEEETLLLIVQELASLGVDKAKLETAQQNTREKLQLAAHPVEE